MVLSTEHRASLVTGLAPVVGEEAAEALMHQFPATQDQEPATAAFVEGAIDAAMVSLKGEMALEFAAVRSELTDGLAMVRHESADDAASIRGEMVSLAGVLRAESADEAARVRGEMESLAGVLRGEMESLAGVLRAEMEAGSATLRGEMDSGFATVHGDLAELRTETTAGFTGLREAMRADLAFTGQEFNEVMIRQIRWFTVMMVTAMGTLFGICVAAIIVAA